MSERHTENTINRAKSTEKKYVNLILSFSFVLDSIALYIV